MEGRCVAPQPSYRDTVWDDYETEEPNRDTRRMHPALPIGIALFVVVGAILAMSWL
jgi:hypothetical protein